MTTGQRGHVSQTPGKPPRNGKLQRLGLRFLLGKQGDQQQKLEDFGLQRLIRLCFISTSLPGTHLNISRLQGRYFDLSLQILAFLGSFTGTQFPKLLINCPCNCYILLPDTCRGMMGCALVKVCHSYQGIPWAFQILFPSKRNTFFSKTVQAWGSHRRG